MKNSFVVKFIVTTIIFTFIILSLFILSPQLIYAQKTNRSSTLLDNIKTGLTNNAAGTPTLTADQNKSNPSDNIADIRITGNVQNNASDILKIIKTKTNRPFNSNTLEEDKRSLMNTGLFIDVKLKVEKTPAGYIVTFIFFERPIIHYIRFIGNQSHTRQTLLEEINLRVKECIDPIAIRQAKERLENFYREGGYHNVYVEILSGDKIGDRGVVFNISEGTQQKILSVSIEGSKTVSGEHLKTLLQSKRGVLWNFGGEFTRKKLDEDVETLIAYYRKLGFFYAKVDREFAETSGGYTGLGKNRKWVKVKFIIDEGSRCKVRNIKFTGQKSYAEEELKKLMQLSREKYFNQDMLETDIMKIREKYGEIGHVFASIEPDPRIDDDIVDVVINIKEGPKCYLRNIDVEIIGHEGADPYTKWNTVLNRLSIRPGEVLNTKEIEASKRRLMASGLFVSNPMQGLAPEITFSVPENLNQEKEEQEQQDIVVADGPVVRGQNYRLNNSQNNKKSPTQNQQNYYPQYKNQQQNQRQNIPYQPPQTPVKPLNLTLKKFDKNGNENLHSTNTDEIIYRGQYNPNNNSTNQNYANQNYSSSVRSQVVQPQSAPINVTNNTSGSVALLYDQPPNYQPPAYQPSNYQAPVYQQTVYHPPLFQPASLQPTQYNLPASEVAQNNAANNKNNNDTNYLYMPPLFDLSGNKPAGKSSALNADDIYLGNNNNSDATISRSAYAIDPNSASQDKIYPSDMVVKVQETRTGMIMLSVAVNSDSGLMGRFMIEEQNFDILNFPRGLRLQDWKNAFRGKGQRFRIEAMPGTEISRYSASWETPYLFNLDYSFGVNGYYYQRFYDEWYEDRVGGAVSFGKLWTPDFLTSLTLSGQEVKIYNPSVYSLDLLQTVGRHPMYGVGINARHNTRDSEYRPTQGHLISFGVEQVFGDYRFVRGNIDVRKYFMLHERPDRSGRWVLGLRCSLDVTESGTPIYERYFGGGASSLRGFEYRGISPRNSLGVIEGGCVEFYNSAELIFPITADDMVMGSIFIDSGTVEKSMKKWEDDYRVSVGFGLYLTIPMMGPAPIALNFGFPISKSPLDEKQVFAFMMGWQR
ncbi:MAG: BamA/TamA family outer membrane protein [Planctomycetaceae bacterium]|jgi:outer membrane protein insertion porin family|nr:BamA/TamA family outer membrane protein [Planctomycetaceae bacterium]